MTASLEERSVFCSDCYTVFPESQVRVIPCFNDDVKGYVTTYHCETCWLPGLDQTIARLSASENEAEIASMGRFFESYMVLVHESQRGDPLPTVRGALVKTLEKIRSGAISLSMGSDQPLDEVLEWNSKKKNAKPWWKFW